MATNNPGDPLITGLPLFWELNSKVAVSAIGGLCVKMINKTGSPSVKGQLVKADTATDDGVILTGADDIECFGVFLEDGIANDAEAWIVIGGIADVALDDNSLAAHGNWVGASEAGYADATNASPPAAPTHFRELGHVLESVSATGGGTHVLARCLLHFN